MDSIRLAKAVFWSTAAIICGYFWFLSVAGSKVTSDLPIHMEVTFLWLCGMATLAVVLAFHPGME